MFCSELRSRAVAPPALCRHRSAARFSFVLLTAAAVVPAQASVAQPGFAATATFTDTAHAASIRGVFALPGASDRHLVMTPRILWEAGATFDPASGHDRRVIRFATEDIAFVDVATTANGTEVLAAGLASGRIVRADLTTYQVTQYAIGVANAFDAVRLANGDLLLSANPTWPASGAASGVWLVGPGKVPRELLRLVGPSGPLALDAAGDLIVGEIGPIAPPPPGTARLLRIPAARVQQAILGASLTMADVSAIGAGWHGLYDLVVATDGRIVASDPASNLVHATVPGGLTPAAVWCDVGAGRFATRMRWHDAANANTPFAGYMPAERAPALSVLCSDYVAASELVRIAPQRPRASVQPGPTLPPGAASLELTAAPPLGLAVWFASVPTTAPEQPLAAFPGAPLWHGLDPASAVAIAMAPIDANGAASVPWANPGGVPMALTVQALTLGAQAGVHGTAAPLAVQLLP
jgi:hypothetical protein